MEEHFNSIPAIHLLQHTLRSLCIHEDSLWVYAVFWRILPRNYPQPNWDFQEGAFDRSRGNRRNWILVWEDGFCNFIASTTEINPGAGSSVHRNSEVRLLELQPELFFKMSHEIYKYGEDLIGKVAADHSHKWIYKEHSDPENNLFSAWQNSGDLHPRTWRAQFQTGIKTIALIAVKEGVLQLGSVKKVTEDLNYVTILQKKFTHLLSIPGFLLPHPASWSSSSIPSKINCGSDNIVSNTCPFQAACPPLTAMNFYDHANQPMVITPSMSSLEALLSKLPSVEPTPSTPLSGYHDTPPRLISIQKPLELDIEVVAMEINERKEH
ncbi:protein RICE SALT SENSITIVE 3-like [Vitis riparia]|uniref:protein RICE SALT SENSITIVE 3-like n=1 Tax=Vitis riparia TaxID=96939 RepID=UPI00155ACE07|nr:protein RICE SALT SENSITIVE 3-like [Vitis riparia]